MALTLKAAGITKIFDGKYANRGVDFEARSGEIHAILGENGAGKSTLIQVLCGQYTADAGTISINRTSASLSVSPSPRTSFWERRTGATRAPPRRWRALPDPRGSTWTHGH